MTRSRRDAARPPSRLPRALGSLRRRFALLLVFLAVSSLLPSALAVGLHAHLDGFGRRLELAGTLRYQTLQLLMITGRRGQELPLAPDEVDDLVHVQLDILDTLVDGSAVARIPPCADAVVCGRLKGLRESWSTRIIPRAAASLEAGSPAAHELANALFRELAATDRTVQVMAERLDGRVDEIVWRGLGALVVSLMLLAMVGYGVWEVFARIRRLEEASGDPPRERELEAQGHGPDEVASLARTLLTSLRSLRQRNAADRRRAAELDDRQQALRSLAASLAAWIEGHGPLDGPLEEAAARAGFTGARVEWVAETDALEAPAGGGGAGAPELALGARPITELQTEDGTSLIVPLAWGDLLLARLHLTREAPLEDPESLAVVDAFGRTLAIALVARRLLSERESRSRLAGHLSTLHELDEGVATVGDHLRRLLPFDDGVLALTEDGGGTRSAWSLTGGEPPETPALSDLADGLVLLDHDFGEGPRPSLAIPLEVEGRRVGALLLGRRSGPFTDRDREVAGAVAPLLASTLERIRLTERLHLSEQLATVGGLSRMVAHEIRNPLNSLGLHLSLLERRLRRAGLDEAAAEPVGEHIGVLRSEVRRLNAVVESYVALATGRGGVRFEAQDLRALVDEVLAVHRAWADERGVRLEVELGERPAEVAVDRTRIQQAVHNLVRNALEAVEGRPGARIGVRLEPEAEGWALRVRDSGPGLPDPKRAFSPGYTTKGAGSGMGLPISLQIARLHGGTVAANRPEGGGAELVLRLPAAPPDTPLASAG